MLIDSQFAKWTTAAAQNARSFAAQQITKLATKFLSRLGAKLSNGTEIRKSKLRSVESEGMLCSPIELGLGEDATGLLICAPDAKIGAPIANLFQARFDLDVEITQNDGDLLSHFALAREIAALSGKEKAQDDGRKPS